MPHARAHTLMKCFWRPESPASSHGACELLQLRGGQSRPSVARHAAKHRGGHGRHTTHARKDHVGLAARVLITEWIEAGERGQVDARVGWNARAKGERMRRHPRARSQWARSETSALAFEVRPDVHREAWRVEKVGRAEEFGEEFILFAWIADAQPAHAAN